MFTLKSDNTECTEEDEEGNLYQHIFELSQVSKEETEYDHSSGLSSDQPTSSSEQRSDAAGSSKTIKEEVSENTQNVPEPTPTVQPLEKPWRSPGANISDYFNYGFDEQSWKTYCTKQFELQVFKRKHEAKKKRPGSEKACRPAPSSSSRPSIQAVGESEDSTDVSGGHSGRSSREEGRPRLTDAANKPKEITNRSHKELGVLPSPAFLEKCGSPSCSFFRSGRPTPSPAAVPGRYQPKGIDGRSTPRYRSSSGKGNVSTRGAVVGMAKASERYIRQQQRDGNRGRARKYGCDKKSKTPRDEAKQNSSSSHNSREQQTKHVEAAESSSRRRRANRVGRGGRDKHKRSTSETRCGCRRKKSRENQRPSGDVGRSRRASR